MQGARIGNGKKLYFYDGPSSVAGGQKVKVVLAAAMWNCPHLLVLDEPTNYLDRDSLGALADAIKVFEGGVVMISHNAGAFSRLSFHESNFHLIHTW